jgi:hypothetical protein
MELNTDDPLSEPDPEPLASIAVDEFLAFLVSGAMTRDKPKSHIFKVTESFFN